MRWADAIEAWARAGRPVLQELARTYGAYVTYQDLAERVQRQAGITTGVPFRHWIGQVLGVIAAEQRSRPDEPFLTALVVRADGTIGEGYAIPVEARDGDVPADLEMHAAEERLRCYARFGAELPSDGGRPMLTRQVELRRSSAQLKSPQQPRPVCPSCYLQLPGTGICDTCAS